MRTAVLACFLAAGLCQAEPLTWITSRSAALNQAASQGKRVLLVAGRLTCENCEALRNDICETNTPPVKALLQSEFVPWYCDIDTQPSSEWSGYASGMGGITLPLVCIIDPKQPATYVARRSGAQVAGSFYNWTLMNEAFTNPVIQSVVVSNGWANLALKGLTFGTTLRIERCTNLQASNWTSVATFTCTARSTNVASATGSNNWAFYRVNASR